jgi:diaminopimelate epimerase
MSFETAAGNNKGGDRRHEGKASTHRPSELKLDYPIALEERELFISSVNTGVPHAVLLTDDIEPCTC